MSGPEAEPGFEDLRQTIIDVHELFATNELPHAFGGAIALAFYTEPRGTADIDVNVFLPNDQGQRVLHILDDTMPAEEAENHLLHIAKWFGANVPYHGTEVDLFFSFADLHDKVAERIRYVEYRGVSIPILSPEDLLIFKVMYGGNPERQDRDWPDIAGMIRNQAGKLDHSYIYEWLNRLLDEDDPRFERLRSLGLPAPDSNT